MQYLNPVVAKVSPNLYAAAKTANMSTSETTQVEQMSYTINEHRRLTQLDPNVAKAQYSKLDPGIQDQLKFMFKNADYMKAGATTGDYIRGALLAPFKVAVSPLVGLFKLGGAYNQIINEPYKVIREVTQGANPFAYKTWKDAWDGKSVYDLGALQKATDTYGQYDVAVAKGLLAGKTPGEIVQSYGKVDSNILDSIKKAYNNPKSFQEVMDNVKFAQVSPGRDLARMLDDKPPADGGLHGSHVNGTLKFISGAVDFAYQVAIDPLTWLSGGTSKFVTRGDKIANGILSEIDNGAAPMHAIDNAFNQNPQLYTLWQDQLGPRLKAFSEAKGDIAKAAAYREIKVNHPEFDNPAAIKALTTKDKHLPEGVVDAASAKKYFENGLNLAYLMSGRVNGVTYMRNGVAVARKNRQVVDGLIKKLDDKFNFNRAEADIAKPFDEVVKALANPVDAMERLTTGDAGMKVVLDANKEISGWKKIGQLMSRSPNGLEVRTGEHAVETAANFTARAQQILPRDMAEALTQRFLASRADEQFVILRNLDAATMYSMGLGGVERGEELINKVLRERYGQEASFATKETSKVNPEHAKVAPVNAVQVVDGIPESITYGPIHPYQSTKAVGSLPYDEIGSMIWDIKSKKNLINAVGGATQGSFSKKLVDAWSILTLFPRLGIRSAIDEAVMYILAAPTRDLLAFASRQGNKLGNISRAFTGSKSTTGPVKQAIQKLFKTAPETDLIERIGKKLQINPEEALTAAAREQALQDYAIAKGVDVGLLSSLQKREALSEHVANIYAQYVNKESMGYLFQAFMHSPDALNSMAQSLIAHSAISGKFGEQVLADLITPTMLDKAFTDAGVKMSKGTRTLNTNQLTEREVAIAHYEKFYKAFVGNRSKLGDTVYLNPASIFFKNNGLKTGEDMKKALDEGMYAIGYRLDPITDMWNPSNFKTIEHYLSQSSTTQELKVMGLSNDEIVRTRLFNLFRDMHETFHGDSEKFNETLMKLVKTKEVKLNEALDKANQERRATKNEAIASISLDDFHDATEGFRIKGQINTAIDFGDLNAENVFRKFGNKGMEWMDQQVTGLFRQPAIMVTYTELRKKYAGIENAFVKQQYVAMGGKYSVHGNVMNDALLADATQIAQQKFTEVCLRDAADKVLKFADNPAIRSNAAYSIRTVGRYYRATEDFYRRIYRLKDVSPQVLYRMRLSHLGLSATGMVHTDQNNEPYIVMPMDNIIFKATNGTLGILEGKGLSGYTQPNFNQFTLKLRMMNPSFAQDSGLPTLSGPVAGLSVIGVRNILGNVPGKIPFIGRFLDAPSKQAAMAIDTVALGNIGTNISAAKAIIPAGLQHVWSMLPFDEQNRQEVTAAQQAIAYHASHGDFLTAQSTDAEKAAYLDRMRITAHNTIFLRNLLGMIGPVNPTAMESKGVPDYLKNVGVTSLRAEFFDILNGITKANNGDITDPYEQALATYVGKYPGKLIYTVSRDAKQTRVIVKNTQQLKSWAISNQNMINTYGEAAYIFAPQVGKFNAASYNWIQAAGLMQSKSLDQYYKDLMVAQDKQAYYDVARNEKALLEVTPDAMARTNIINDATSAREALKAGNPLLSAALVGQGNNIGNEQTLLGNVEQIINNPSTPVDTSTRQRMAAAIKLIRTYTLNCQNIDAQDNMSNKVDVKSELRTQVEEAMKELMLGDLYVTEANRAIFSSIIKAYSRDSYYATKGLR